jgi:ferrous iron transport protein B
MCGRIGMTATIPLIALVGNPNAGKSALFNALTGARQKIANYPGVTVERKSGRWALPDGRPIELVDLPGTYSLIPDSLDEQVTRNVVLGMQEGHRRPDALVIVVDAANLDNHLRFTLELIALGLPVVVALNMIDLAERDGLEIDVDKLSAELGVPVIPTVAVRKRGLDPLAKALASVLAKPSNASVEDLQARLITDRKIITERAHKLARSVVLSETATRQGTRLLDSVLLHPVGGVLILFALLFVIFQGVFSWSQAPIGWIEALFAQLTTVVNTAMPAGLLRSLVVDGVIAGVGAVIVFLPQILILFLFIQLLEASGYMTRAAFVMDRMMAAVGLSGHSFIPLLSSFACAIPGIMATRTIMDQKDRLTTILIAPLMTCSARLPVYTVIIGAFIPATRLGLGIGLQGLVLFVLYLAGIIGAMLASLLIKRTVTKGSTGSFLIEMPRYQWPLLRDIALGLWQRAWLFMRRAGTIIFASTIILWVLLTFPKTPVDSGIPQSQYSIAGRIAGGLEVIVKPIGFNRDIALALIPAMAAREVAVSALATTYAIDEKDENKQAESLGAKLAGKWSLATALAFLAWFVFAPQCISTIAVTRRETNGWKWPAFMVGYLFVLAYVAAGITYWTASAFGLG